MKQKLRSIVMAGACALAFMLSSGAHAASGWFKAQSDNFVVYSDTDERTLRKYTEQLEYFRTLPCNSWIKARTKMAHHRS